MPNVPIDDPDILDLISNYISRKVVLDAYFGTCALYVPPGMKVSVGDICGEAGYIHSVGRIVQFRSAVKATPTDLHDLSVRFLAASPNDQRPIFIVPYSHEGFSEADKGSPFLKGGLDDVKIYLGKTHVGSDVLSKVLDELREKVRETRIECEIAESNDYKKELSSFRAKYPNKDIRCWFVIMDSDLESGNRFPSDKKYLVVYEQLFKNLSPYHWFDENNEVVPGFRTGS